MVVVWGRHRGFSDFAAGESRTTPFAKPLPRRALGRRLPLANRLPAQARRRLLSSLRVGAGQWPRAMVEDSFHRSRAIARARRFEARRRVAIPPARRRIVGHRPLIVIVSIV